MTNTVYDRESENDMTDVVAAVAVEGDDAEQVSANPNDDTKVTMDVAVVSAAIGKKNILLQKSVALIQAAGVDTAVAADVAKTAKMLAGVEIADVLQAMRCYAAVDLGDLIQADLGAASNVGAAEDGTPLLKSATKKMVKQMKKIGGRLSSRRPSSSLLSVQCDMIKIN